MPVSRILLWLLLMAAAWLFRLSYIGWLGPWVLAVVALLPPVMFLLSLPGMLRLQLRLEAPGRTVRGKETSYRIVFLNPGWMPVHAVSVRLLLRNSYNGETWKQSYVFRKVETGSTDLPLPVELCGLVTCSVVSCDLMDWLGMFSIRRHPAAECHCAVLPEAVASDTPVRFESSLTRTDVLVPKYGGGFAEEHDLREYRPGDLPNSIHWKLSSKMDELIVREPLVPENSTVYVVLARAGERDRGLEILRWLSRELLNREEPHVIVADSLYPVSSEEDTDAALASMLAWPMREPCGFDAKQARCIFTIRGGEVRTE